MKYRTILKISALLVLLPVRAAVAQQGAATGDDNYPRIRFGMDAVTVWQALENRNDPGTLPNLSTGMQAALGNLQLNVALADGIDVYAEFYLSSKHHPGEVMDREGWMYISKLPDRWDLFGLNTIFKYIDIKAGHFEVDFGNQHLTRSDNAQVQKNPLIGNYIVDPNTVEAGLEVIGNEGTFNWLAGFGSGVTVEDFQPGRGYSLHGKLWLEPDDSRFNVAASVYRANHSGNPTGYPNDGSSEELFSGNRSGSRYSGVINLTSPDAGQLNLGRGQDVTAWQLDAGVNLEPFEISGLFGQMQDGDVNGSDDGEPHEEWTYFGAEAKVDLLFDMVYLAIRYSRAATSMYRGAETDANADRFQIGLGYWLIDNILLKAEYVTQHYNGFTQTYVGNPRFSGILAEASMSF